MPIPLGVLAVAGAGAAGAGGSFDLLETTLITTDTASVTFSNLNNYADYKHLQLRTAARSNNTTGDNIRLQFNGDTGNNYAVHGLYGNGQSVLSFASTSLNFVQVGESETSTADANIYSSAVADILDFSSANKNKTVRALGANHGTFVILRSGVWLSTSAVTSIVVYLSANSFTAGSRISLYGYK